MENIKDFHYLIEIAVKLNRALNDCERVPSPSRRKDVSFWKNKLQEWIETNYEYDGVNREIEKRIFNEKVEYKWN